jgi:hypothetical protein
MINQCSSCGGFCRKSGCERENVKPELQRTWVGLTDEEENEYNYLGPDMHWVIQEIAAKLKEKNTWHGY